MNALLSALGDYDHRLLMAVLARRRRALDHFMRAVTRLADPIPAIGFGCALSLGPSRTRGRWALDRAPARGVGLWAAGSALVLALGMLVGASRCYLGVHYPGDVLAGWALAALVFAILA